MNRGNVNGGLKRDHGVALVPALNRGFISDGSAAEVAVFDLKTFAIVNRIQGEHDADSILYDPFSKHVFVFNGDSNSATVIEPAKDAFISSLKLGGAPRAGRRGRQGNDLQQSRR